MQKYALILAALVMGASLKADEMAANTSDYSVTADFTYASKYVFRGLETQQDSFQPSVKVTSGDFYASLWTNQPIKNNADNEIDLNAGYSYKINKTWSIDGGATYYYYPEANASSGNPEYTTEAYLGVNGSVAGVSVGGYLYRDFNWNSYTAQANVGYSLPLNDTTSLNLSANLGRVTNVGASSYNYYTVGAAIPFKVNKATTLTTGVSYASHNNEKNTSKENDSVWFNVGMAVSF